MLRRIFTIGLIVLGVVAIALAAASATVWRSSETVTADLSNRPEAPLVITDAGVLDLVADDVTIRVTDPGGGPVVAVVGRESDVLGWVGESPHTRITGLTSWTRLSTASEDGDVAAASPQGSDMWVVEATGDGEARVEWTHPGGRWILLAATDGTAPGPEVEFSWPQEVATPFLVPGLVVGTILLLTGLVLAGTAYLERREIRGRDAARAEPGATGDLPAVVTTGDLPASTGDAPTTVLTRRQLRDLAKAQAAEPRIRPDAPPEAPLVEAEGLDAEGRASVGPDAVGPDVVGPDAKPPDTEGPALARPPAGPDAQQSAETTSAAAAASPWRRAWGLRTAGSPPDAQDPGSAGVEPAEQDGTSEEGKE